MFAAIRLRLDIAQFTHYACFIKVVHSINPCQKNPANFIPGKFDGNETLEEHHRCNCWDYNISRVFCSLVLLLLTSSPQKGSNIRHTQPGELGYGVRINTFACHVQHNGF